MLPGSPTVVGGQSLLEPRKERMRPCNAAGCNKFSVGYSTLCENHRKTKARHGHPLQTAVRRHELKPYEKAIKRWLETRSSPEAWNILEDHWKALTASCGVYRERVGHGRPYQKNIRQACETILRVDAEKHHREAIIRVLAMGYLRHAQPRRFRSDQALGGLDTRTAPEVQSDLRCLDEEMGIRTGRLSSRAAGACDGYTPDPVSAASSACSSTSGEVGFAFPASSGSCPWGSRRST